MKAMRISALANLFRLAIRRVSFFVLSPLLARPKLKAKLIRLLSRFPILYAYLKTLRLKQIQHSFVAHRSSSCCCGTQEVHILRKQLEEVLLRRRKNYLG